MARIVTPLMQANQDGLVRISQGADGKAVVKFPNQQKSPLSEATLNRLAAQQAAPAQQQVYVQPSYNNQPRQVGGGYTQPVYDPAAAAAAQAATAAAAKKAEEDAKRNKLRGEGNSYLDKLMKEYDAILKEIERVGTDQTNRLNKEYDTKVQGQVEDMNYGMYDVDASAAAANLADSSFRSFDRGKVRKVADQNISTLNMAREGDLAEVGSMVNRETARFKGERDGIARTRRLLGEEEDLGALQNTVNSLDKNYRGMGAEKARFGTQGDFVTAANKLGNYDTSTLEASLQSVVSNASATPSTKQAAVRDILSGSGVDDKTRKRLENKYIQIV